MNYAEFFTRATGHPPYPYQARLAHEYWPDVLDIPTGLGKTAAVTLAWLYRRRQLGEPDLPRRLVWCLPMRVLVEQTVENARTWLKNLDLGGEPGEGRVSVHVLMGGEATLRRADWAAHPEEETILIGTQDMLLSRALMRGYGMSRYQWPIHYALLHNDAQWIFDEVQLMGPALPTSTQLEAFRRDLGVDRPARSTWVSATLKEEWLDSVDFRPHRETGLHRLSLDAEDRAEPAVRQRTRALKRLARATTWLADGKKSAIAGYARSLAEEVLECHAGGRQTLIILNSVERAQAVFDALQESGIPSLLLHARFRQNERQRIEARLQEKPGDQGRIVVATQAIEAGVDLDSKVMFTELAPWASLVQRFGRCNRAGRFASGDPAQIFWIDIDEQIAPLALPYEAESMAAARGKLEAMDSASPEALPSIDETHPPRLVLRRRDLEELFNTDPDLSGFDVDVSPYIRDTGRPQVQLFWRSVDKQTAREQGQPLRAELCPASITQVRDHLGKKLPAPLRRATGREYPAAWRFDPLAGEDRQGRWQPVRAEEIRPGQTVMLAAEDGGYDPDRGFMAGLHDRVDVIDTQSDSRQPEADGSDFFSFLGDRVTLASHLEEVATEATKLSRSLQLSEGDLEALETAGFWHDVGKSHEAFQRGIGFDPEDPEGPWAKSDGSGRPNYHVVESDETRRPRPGFRHELASMLAWLEHAAPDTTPGHRDLVAYLIAAHHGKIRMGLRAQPDEPEPPDPEALFARGVWTGDRLPALKLGRFDLPPTTLRLDLMRLGRGPQGPSWSERTQSLLANHGPFRLAWLEALVRIADWRGSARAKSSEQEESG